MSLTVTAPPDGLVLDLEALKSDLGITTNDDDERLTRLIERAAAYVEKDLDIALLTTEYLWALPGFGSARGELDDFWFDPIASASHCSPILSVPRAPLVSVQSVKYYDDAGVLQTISSGNYQVDIRSKPGRIAPVYTYTWPTPGRRLDPVEIAFTAGYGASSDDVPADLKGAISMLVAHWNENREAFALGIMTSVPLGYDELVQPFKHWSR